MFFILLPLFLLVSCGDNYGFRSKNLVPDTPAHDSFFDEYIRNIESDIKKATGKDYHFNVPVVFGPLDDVYNGMCYSYEDPKYNYIVLNRNVFIQKDGTVMKNDLEQVLSHELGHCYFHREHLNFLVKRTNDPLKFWYSNIEAGFITKEDLYGKSQGLTPKSVMWPIYIDIQLYLRNKEYYFKELVNEKMTFDDIYEIYNYSDESLPRYSHNIEYSIYNKNDDGLVVKTLDYYEFIDKLYGVRLSKAKLVGEENFIEYNDHVHISSDFE